MDEFIRGGVRAVMNMRNDREREILESTNYLLRDVCRVVLEYTYISDSFLNDGAFDDQEIVLADTSIKDIKIVKSHTLDMFAIECSARLYRPYSNMDDIMNSWIKYEIPIVFILEALVSRNQLETVMKFIRFCSSGDPRYFPSIIIIISYIMAYGSA